MVREHILSVLILSSAVLYNNASDVPKIPGTFRRVYFLPSTPGPQLRPETTVRSIASGPASVLLTQAPFLLPLRRELDPEDEDGVHAARGTFGPGA
jgi:hypothetical protein